MPGPRIAIVTDSPASLPEEVVEEHGIFVVPLQVIIGATSYDEGVDEGASPAMVAQALREFTPVSTSRPSPARMLEIYADIAEQGYEEIVSVHLSGEMSGTFDSALVASRTAVVPVHPVDSRQVGPATGYGAVAAAVAVASGASAAEAALAARQRAEASTSLFYVDTLEYLRRGGRVGAAAALLGGALAVKPLLRVSDGKIDSFEKVRTAGRALARLEEHAVQAADEQPVEVTVAHLASPERAEALAAKLAGRLDLVTPVRIAELGAVLGAHVGPGMVAVCVAPALEGAVAAASGPDSDDSPVE
ncbi:DegV family protein [Nocardioides daejeonensis]|uniref:DegV family protein n=1 Tax=Nocardioides daejeonensis TaxID=1046556 RepID=UPI000D744600|nr:DegV family protein [Nocardioides daejeonensis]